MRKHNYSFKAISVLMGLGHIRAAYPFKRFISDDIYVYGNKNTTPKTEYKLWNKIRRIYYFVSKAVSIPIFGNIIGKALNRVEKIEPYYPAKDLSKPNMAVRYLKHLTKRRNFFKNIKELIKNIETPVLHTFYATALAVDNIRKPDENYLLICDADFNRVWVSDKPEKSSINYLAPCTQAKWRLERYGVRKELVHLTGFPLPIENIGSRESLEILREDLFKRLHRLDPRGKFFNFHKQSVLYWLKQQSLPEIRDTPFTLTYAVGGAGAQVAAIKKILCSLKQKILEGKIMLNFSAGIQKPVYETILSYINNNNLISEFDKSIRIIYDHDVFTYLDKFNQSLRNTDILWTKPSELSFYCGLGIPIILSPSIGAHEISNRYWLREINAGIKIPGPLEYAHQWLFDLRNNGRFAEAAWSGFLKTRKLGTYKIIDLITKGSFDLGFTPLEQ